MESYHLNRHGYPSMEPGPVQRPPLPAWARVFRLILMIFGGLLTLLLLLLFSMSTSGRGGMYTDEGIGFLQTTFWLGLATVVLTIPYLVASTIYGAVWAGTLRGRGYRRYPGTTWILVAGPLIVGLPVVAVIVLLVAPPSLL